MSSELIWQYVISEENPSAEDYLTWAQNQTDPEQTFFTYKQLLTFVWIDPP